VRKGLRLGAALLAACVLAACTVGDSNGESGSESAKEITFLVFETPNLTPQVWDAAIKRATDQHPDITVRKLVSPTQDRTAYAKQLLASGQFPDVMVAVSPAGLAESGNLYAWQPDELKDFTCPTCGAINGKVYQLPANTQTIPVVYYNKDLFSEAGVSAAPKTYAELLDVAAKLDAKGTTPFVVGQGHDSLGPTWAGIIATEVYAKNPDWMADRRAGKVRFSDPDFKRAATKLADLAAKGYIDKRMLPQDYAAAQEAFLGGKGAMYAMGNWFAAAADNPSTKPEFEVGQFFWPSDDGTQVISAFTGGGLSINAKAQNLDAAKRFALAFQLDKTNLDASTRNDGLFPAVKGYSPPADAAPVFKEGYDQYTQGQAQGATVVPPFGFESGDAGMLPGVIEKWDASAADLVTGRKTPDEVCAFLDAEWEKAT
jgi:ABC-type glycerol-3-phosphate transport system substrate-binding protein